MARDLPIGVIYSTNPTWQAESKKPLGNDLPLPPQTQDQVCDPARFFNGKIDTAPRSLM